MVGVLSRIRVTDGSGVRLVQCIKVLGGSFKWKAYLGDSIIAVVKRVNANNPKFKKGTIVRALIVRVAMNFKRSIGIWLKFGYTAVVLINTKKAPISKRIKGPMVKEVCLKYTFLGTISRFVI